MSEKSAVHLTVGVTQPPDSRVARCRNCQEPLAVPKDWPESTWFRCQFCQQGQTVGELFPAERADVVKMDWRKFLGDT